MQVTSRWVECSREGFGGASTATAIATGRITAGIAPGRDHPTLDSTRQRNT